MRDSLRTFVAVEPPGEIKQLARQLIDRLRPAADNVKWATPDELHWTIKFLGEVELVDTPRICDCVAEAVADIQPFDVETFGAGAFPDPYDPRTIWLGIRDGTEDFRDLHAAIERNLAGIGFRVEPRQFRPHLTLGRVRRSAGSPRELGDLIVANADFDAGMSTIFEVGIFSSELLPRGPRYEVLGHAELGQKARDRPRG